MQLDAVFNVVNAFPSCVMMPPSFCDGTAIGSSMFSLPIRSQLVPDNASGPHPGPTFGDSELSALRSFVGGYLHQDFVAEHKTPAAALNAYCRDAGRREILELENDLGYFLSKTSAQKFGDVRELFVRELHSGWTPPDRAALAHLLRMVCAQLKRK